MKRIEDYRANADECRSLARKTRNQHERNQLLKMAEGWDRFALERERRTKDAEPAT